MYKCRFESDPELKERATMGKKRKLKPRITGISKDGKIKTITGMFQMYDTYGLPFEISFMGCKKKDQIPDWVDMYIQAVKISGWGYKRLRSRLSMAILDVWGKDARDKVLDTLDWLDRNGWYLFRYVVIRDNPKLSEHFVVVKDNPKMI